jgi:hypothetical protein
LTYTSTWEPINEALQRVVAAGLSEKQVKRDLCRAIADYKIEIRLHLAADRSRGLPPKVLSPPALEIPQHLSPADFDWPSSRMSPHSQLWTGPSQRLGQSNLLYFHENNELVDRTVDLIELRVADVTKVFFNTESQPKAKPAAGSPAPRPNKAAKATGVEQAIEALWGSKGIPSGLSAKDRDRQIVDWLKDRNLSIPKLRTIQRALKRHGR